MNLRRSVKWEKHRRHATQKCEALALKFSEARPAVPLNKIAAECKVRDVVFRPLFVDGGLGLHPQGGFVVYVKCDRERAAEHRAEFDAGGYHLPGRMRFTIAHEIVHTFFIDPQTPYEQLKQKKLHPNELNALEQTCDYAANRLLIPDIHFRRFLSGNNYLSAQQIIRISADFSVSPNAVISRLADMGSWGGYSGNVAIVDFRHGDLVFDMTASDFAARQLFKDAVRGAAVRNIVFDPLLQAFGGNESLVHTSIPCFSGRTPMVQPLIVECAPIPTRKTGYVMTMRLDGPPRESK